MLITFEGGIRSGKSTQAKKLFKHFKSQNKPVFINREPGGPTAAEDIRKILLNPDAELAQLTEFLLYQAARAELVEKFVKQNLEKDRIVILDRYIDSTYAYQGHGRGINTDFITEFEKLVARGFIPDLTFILTIKPEKALNRTLKTKVNYLESRFENEELEFHQKVQQGYLERYRLEKKKGKERIHIIDGDQSKNEVFKQILDLVKLKRRKM